MQEPLAESVAPASGAADIRDGDAPPFEEPAFAEPAHEALYAALGTLPEKCRIVVHLFYFEDMGTREIAEVLGIKEPTVRTRLVRAETTETVTEGGVGR
ncbi:MAG: RNA polymerase sigma factor [Adlercreutzia equolifaciens]